MSDRELDAAIREARKEENVERFDADELEVTYRRIASEVRERRTGGSRRPLFAIGLGLVGAAAAIGLALWLPNLRQSPDPVSTPRVESIRVARSAGRVELRTAGGDPLPLTSEVRAARVDLARGAHADLDIGVARLALRGPASMGFGPVRPKIQNGRVAIQVPARPRGSPFSVDAGAATIIVHGTEFLVSVSDGHLNALRVEEGTVELREPGKEPVFLNAGDEHASSEDGEQAWPSDPFDAPWWRERGASVGIGQIEVRSEPLSANVRIEGQRVGKTPLLVSWPAGEYGLVVNRPGHRRFRQRVTVRADETTVVTVELAAVPKRTAGLWRGAQEDLDNRRCRALATKVTALVEQSESREEAARAMMLSAECALRAGSRRKALGSYEEIAKRYADTESAELASFEVAKLTVRLERPRAALQAVDRYLRRYPKGAFVPAAEFRRCDLLIRMNELVRARACLEEYTAQRAGAVHANDATLLLATLSRVEKEWQKAAELYRRYLARAPSSSRREEAMYQLAFCLHEGGLPGVREAVDAYLRRYPDGKRAEAIRELSK